jgi:hypothetical protein
MKMIIGAIALVMCVLAVPQVDAQSLDAKISLLAETPGGNIATIPDPDSFTIDQLTLVQTCSQVRVKLLLLDITMHDAKCDDPVSHGFTVVTEKMRETFSFTESGSLIRVSISSPNPRLMQQLQKHLEQFAHPKAN